MIKGSIHQEDIISKHICTYTTEPKKISKANTDRIEERNKKYTQFNNHSERLQYPLNNGYN